MNKFLTTTIVSTLILIPANVVQGQSSQPNPGTNLPQTSPAREDILRDNQNLNYRTNQQIFNRRVNNALTECSASAGNRACSQAVPEAETWKGNENLRNIENQRLR